MSTTFSDSKHISEQVLQAHQDHTTLNIRGGESKSFLGRARTGTPLDIAGYQGIIDYQPAELVITCRAGTALQTVQDTLAEQGQYLPFEPPIFTSQATIGGTIACGMAGAIRPYTGAARDFVLGMRIVNGTGKELSFGGQVMKNVAGYDASRLMVGAMGSLGVILEVSLKVLPKPPAQCTLILPITPHQALEKMRSWRSLPLPITGVVFYQDQLYVRLAGEPTTLDAAAQIIGAQPTTATTDFWQQISNQTHPFFTQNSSPLWRLSLPADTPELALSGTTLWDWGGQQRWLYSDAPAEIIRDITAQQGGHASIFRSAQTHDAPFHPLTPDLHKYHKTLKKAFDPKCILNPGRMYKDL